MRACATPTQVASSPAPRRPPVHASCPSVATFLLRTACPPRRQRYPQRPDRGRGRRQQHQPGAERPQEISQRLRYALSDDPAADARPSGIDRLVQTQVDEADDGQKQHFATNDGAPAHLPTQPPREGQHDAAQDHCGDGDERPPAQQDAHWRRSPCGSQTGNQQHERDQPGAHQAPTDQIVSGGFHVIGGFVGTPQGRASSENRPQQVFGSTPKPGRANGTARQGRQVK